MVNIVTANRNCFTLTEDTRVESRKIIVRLDRERDEGQAADGLDDDETEDIVNHSDIMETLTEETPSEDTDTSLRAPFRRLLDICKAAELANAQ